MLWEESTKTLAATLLPSKSLKDYTYAVDWAVTVLDHDWGLAGEELTLKGDGEPPLRTLCKALAEAGAWWSSRELPTRAAPVPLSASCPHACSSALHACFNGRPAARTGHELRSGADIRASISKLNAAAGASGKFFCYARTHANATKSVRWVSRARIFWEDGPPRPAR